MSALRGSRYELASLLLVVYCVDRIYVSRSFRGFVPSRLVLFHTFLHMLEEELSRVSSP